MNDRCPTMKFLTRTSARPLIIAVGLFSGSGCGVLPDVDGLIEQHQRHAAQAVQFESALGPVSAKRSAAILAELQRKSGDIDVLDKQIALEQAIVGHPLVLGNKVALLEDGAATYAAMFEAIRAAKDHINIESYIFEDDDVGRQFSDLLLQQQARGVQVNLIYDSVGGFNTQKTFYERLIKAGVAVLEFNPLNPLQAKKSWMIYNRDHRKLLVVDGRVVFLGGVNISNVYSAGSVVKASATKAQSSLSWRDTDLQIEGPVVAEFQKLFLQTWAKQNGQALAAKNYFPTLAARGSEIVRAIGSTPDDPYSLIYLTLLSAIGNAEREVLLTNAYFVPDPQLLAALTDAAARGVDVKLILPSQSDSATVFYAGRSHYTNLLKKGVKIYERRGALLHSKTAVIDGVWATVGSTNLDWRSFLDNDEINAVVIGREFSLKMKTMFAKDLASSEAVEQKMWDERPVTMRLKEWLARLWARLL